MVSSLLHQLNFCSSRMLHQFPIYKVLNILMVCLLNMFESSDLSFPCLPFQGLLYFAGHGYENYGNSFMVPIDAPASYTFKHCLWVQDVLQRMQERQTGLNVFLLDMCRKRCDLIHW